MYDYFLENRFNHTFMKVSKVLATFFHQQGGVLQTCKKIIFIFMSKRNFEIKYSGGQILSPFVVRLLTILEDNLKYERIQKMKMTSQLKISPKIMTTSKLKTNAKLKRTFKVNTDPKIKTISKLNIPKYEDDPDYKDGHQ